MLSDTQKVHVIYVIREGLRLGQVVAKIPPDCPTQASPAWLPEDFPGRRDQP